MIVCLDTSASMYGTPERISSTLISLIEETAEELERDCFLIDFSVSTRAIDLMAKRKVERLKKIGINIVEADGRYGISQSSPFYRRRNICEKNDEPMFELLDHDGLHYVNADVLWITDFLIPNPSQAMLSRFKEYKETGTRFYGIRIVRSDDKEPNEWKRLLQPDLYRQISSFETILTVEVCGLISSWSAHSAWPLRPPVLCRENQS